MNKAFRRCLCIFLALVMVLGLGISTSAAGLPFGDSGSIQHKSAVTTLYNAGIITGYPNGNFGPKDTLTRAQACTILTRLLGGNTNGQSSFSDVSRNYWANGYIAYCANNDIVAGYGNGRFGPEDTLTGSAWSKMVLVALGYDPVTQGMTGNSWETGVSSAASTEDLYQGMAGFNPSAVVSRDDACQIAFNCMYGGEIPESEDLDSMLAKLSYSFGNNRETFGYPKSYRIPTARFQFIYGNTEKARQMEMKFGDWSGNCYGMSTTTSMIYQTGNGINASAFRAGAVRSSQLALSDRHNVWKITMQEFIESMHITQLDDDANAIKAKNRNNLAALSQAAQSVQSTGQNPFIVCIWGTYGKGTAGHAIVGYGLESAGSKEDHLVVYDVNSPQKKRYIVLQKNSSGNYSGWSYQLDSQTLWGSHDTNGMITFIPYNTYYQAWQNRKGDLVTSNMLFMSVSDNARITDSNGNLVADIYDGKVTAYRDDVYQIEPIGIMSDGSVGNPPETTFWLPGNEYTVQRTGSNALEVTFTQVNQSVDVTMNGNKVTLAVDDESATRTAQLDSAEKGASYTITIRSSLDNADEPEEITSSGTVPSGGTVVGRDQGQLISDGADNVYVDGQKVQSSSGKDVNDYNVLLSSFNTGAVQNGSSREPKSMPFATTKAPCRIDAITTYHWNYGSGKTPGTISIYRYASSSDSQNNLNGTLVGTWQAYGRSGSGADNVLWDVFPDIILEPGHYAIFDSDPSTWSSNSQSGGLFFTEVRGQFLTS